MIRPITVEDEADARRFFAAAYTYINAHHALVSDPCLRTSHAYRVAAEHYQEIDKTVYSALLDRVGVAHTVGLLTEIGYYQLLGGQEPKGSYD